MKSKFSFASFIVVAFFLSSSSIFFFLSFFFLRDLKHSSLKLPLVISFERFHVLLVRKEQNMKTFQRNDQLKFETVCF